MPGRHLKNLLASAAIKMRDFRIRPVAVAVTMNASFVARGYTVNQEHLADLIAQAVLQRGTALVDILQPCVSFNKVNSCQWFKERSYELGAEHDVTDKNLALKVALEFGEHIPLGVIWKTEKPLYEDQFAALRRGPLYNQETSLEALQQVVASFQ